MNVRRMTCILLAGLCCLSCARPVAAQSCLDGLFGGCFSCGKRPVGYAYAPLPVAPVAAPLIAAPPPVAAVAAPPPPVMVPVQQTSYVPETTYRTEYKCVPVTTYKPSSEVDPCTGCPVDCMQPVTQYVQQPVNVPVTQYRAVTTTKYVQMQPGYPAQGYAAPGYPAQGYPAAPMPAAAPAASPFSAVQTTPQAWGAAGADVSRQPLPGMAAPALPPAGAPPATTYQYSQPTPGPTIVPQAGVGPAAVQPPPLQSTTPPALAPAPSLKPIPEMPRSTGQSAGAPAAGGQTNGQFSPQANGSAGMPMNGTTNGTTNGFGTGVGNAPGSGATTPATGQDSHGQGGMPVLPGSGPGAATGAFPRLLAPTGHTTSWQPSGVAPAAVQYPTAALPAWRGQR